MPFRWALPATPRIWVICAVTVAILLAAAPFATPLFGAKDAKDSARSAVQKSGDTAGAAGPSARTTDKSSPKGSTDEGVAAAAQLRNDAMSNLTKLAQKRAGQLRAEQAKTTFVVASFNVLGASHTSGPSARRGFGSGGARMGGQLDALRARNVSVAGLQEFQPPQVGSLLSRAGSTYEVYPGMSLGPLAADNSIIWRTSDWRLVQKKTVSIPYFHGRIRQMPAVLLAHRSNDRKVWFANFHNPANIGGNFARYRAQAVSIEAALARRLGADGTPVIMTGDMNDRAEYACPFTSKSGMRSANGAHTAGGRCVTPGHMDVDWIMGSARVTFSNFSSDTGVQRARLTDHPLITATVTVSGAGQ